MTQPILAPTRHIWGLYIHVPFCDKVCPYCDFAVTANRRHDHMDYANALLSAWTHRRGDYPQTPPQTLYFGGGTPSMLQWEAMHHLVSGLDLSLATISEVTLEANPSDISPERLAQWATLGINRISLGCQSFQDEMLSTLGRNHSGQQAMDAALMILDHGAFELSIDLIYGGPKHTMVLWQRDLDAVATMSRLNHLSAYQLTVEPNTPFARAHKKGDLTIASESLQVDLLEALRQTLEQMGIEQYEVSSFARPGHHARHNSAYWLGHPYLGLGVGAHSLNLKHGKVSRRANTRKIVAYMKQPGLVYEEETLDAWTHLYERIFVNLRTTLGMRLETLEHQFGPHLEAVHWAQLRQLLSEFVASGLLLEPELGRFIPTFRGLLVGDWMAHKLDLWLVDCQGS